MGKGRITSGDHSKSWPAFLQKAQAKQNLTEDQTEQPVIVVMGRSRAAEDLKHLVAGEPITRVNDNYDEQLAEPVISRNPHIYRANLEVQRASVKDYLNEHYGR